MRHPDAPPGPHTARPRRRLLLALALSLSWAACDGTSTLPGDGDTATDASDTSTADTTTGGDTTSPTDTNPADTSTADTSLPDTSTPDTSTVDTSTVDTATMPDTSTVDTTVPDPCAGIDCGANGQCMAGSCQCDAGYEPDASGTTCVASDPCSGVTCGANSHCEAGDCVCDGGFVDVGGQCVVPDPTDPAQRTQQQVCERWNDDWPTTSTQVFDPGAGLAACDPGTIDPIAHDDAMRRLNLYRWLVGLDPATVNWDNQAKAQAAALMMHANGDLNHDPPMSWTCYSDDGYAGASSSNLSLGRSHPADSVDGYIRDQYSEALGHRRWIFNPSLGNTAFGQYESAGAMWTFGMMQATEPDWIAYPSPGPFPIDGVLGAWSFHRRQDFSNPTVTVTRLSDNTELNIDAGIPPGFNFGFVATVRIDVLDPITAGETYRVEIVDGAESWSYETTPVDCAGF